MQKIMTWYHALHQVTGSMALNRMDEESIKSWIRILSAVIQEMEDYLKHES